MIGPLPCAYACANVDPVFTSQSYHISIITSTRTNLSVFLVLMLMLMSTQSSLAYTCAYDGDVNEDGKKAIGLD